MEIRRERCRYSFDYLLILVIADALVQREMTAELINSSPGILMSLQYFRGTW